VNKVGKSLILNLDTYLGLRNVWQFRELFRQLVARDLKVKYQRSPLGFLWSLLNPLVTSLIIIAIFTYVLRIQMVHYWAFLLSGYFVWNFIQQGLNDATYILKDHSALRRSVAFPAEVLIWSASLSKILEFLVAITLVLVMLTLFHHHSIPSSLVLLPLIILIQIILTVGLMYPLSTASVLFYDVQHALPIVLISLFYISPVFYPVEMIPEAVRPYYFLNPFAGMLTLYQTVLYEGQWPSITLLGVVSASAFAIWLIGYAIFNRYKNICVEIA
jgi:ABC-type polysaccharide/polyol phosphate export permease